MSANLSIDREIRMSPTIARGDKYFLWAVSAVIAASALAPVWSFVAWLWLKSY